MSGGVRRKEKTTTTEERKRKKGEETKEEKGPNQHGKEDTQGKGGVRDKTTRLEGTGTRKHKVGGLNCGTL